MTRGRVVSFHSRHPREMTFTPGEMTDRQSVRGGCDAAARGVQLQARGAGGCGHRAGRFLAPWCGPCRALTPAIHNLAADYKVCQVNIDNNPGLAGRFQVNAVPTLLVFRGGRVLKRIEGAVPEAHLRAELQAADRA